MSNPLQQPPHVVDTEAIPGTPRTVDTGAARAAAAPVVTGWNVTALETPTSLDDLSDVAAPANVTGVLERGTDQIVRPTSRTDLFADHVNSPTPHPVYDDLPSLSLIFDNGMV